MNPEDEQNIADAGARHQAAQNNEPGTAATGQSQQPGAQQPNGQAQPVAYDSNGNPLYAAPPQVVYMSRPTDPHSPDIPEEIKRKHEESRKQYPQLNLSEGEYIISAVKRHPIGVLQIWAGAFIIIALLLALMAAVLLSGDLGLGLSKSDLLGGGTVVIGLMALLIIGGAFLAVSVYNGNKFYLTNESVIQEIQVSLFSKNEQTVSLANIEDASYSQGGIIPTMLNYGRIRLSTEGDETTYRFNYVSNPKQQIALLNNAVEAFKNGRPVGE